MPFYAELKRALAEFMSLAWKKWLIITAIWVIILELLAITEPFLLHKLLSKVEEWIKSWIFDKDWFIFLAWIMIWLSFIVYIARFFYNVFTSHLLLDLHNKFARKYSKQILKMTYWDFLKRKPWKLFKKFDKAWDALFEIGYVIIKEYITALLIIFLSMGIMLYVDYKLALVSFIMIPFMIIIWYKANIKTAKKQLETDEKWSEAYWFMLDWLTNLNLLKNFNQTDNMTQKFWKEVDEARDNQKLLTKFWVFVSINVFTMVSIERVLVVATWGYFIYQGVLTFSQLIFFMVVLWYLYFPLSFIFDNLRRMQFNLSSLKEFYDEIDTIQEEDFRWEEIKKVDWKIEFKNVWFSYTESKKVIDNVNFEIKPWEKVAFVWHTGSWKSTIINLISKFWEVNSWKILLDWKNINEISNESLRKHIWIVSQDNSLFNMTIRENLEIAGENIDEEKIKWALKHAQADFVEKAEKWLDTKIWERWLKLSWWEKQRLSIARIFLKNPEILILDEATSALDNKTELKIQESLEELMEGKTSIIVAHRLSTIKKADKIFMMENGKIIETWTYNELIKKGWKFSELANPEKAILA